MTTPAEPGQSLVQREPALVYGGGLTGASLIVNTIVDLGIPLSDTTKTVIMLAVSVVGPFVGTLLTRQKVRPNLPAQGASTPPPNDLGRHAAP